MSTLGGTTSQNTPPAARELLRLQRRMRRRSPAARPASEVLSDLYIAGLAVLMAVTMFGRPFGEVLHDAASRSTDGRAPVDLPLALAIVWALALLGGALRLLTLVGPLVRDPAEATWLLGSPVDRRGLLLPAALGLLSSCAAAGAAAALVVPGLLGIPWSDAPWWMAIGACAGVALGAATVAVQGTGRTRALRRTADGALLGAFVVLMSSVWRASQHHDQRLLNVVPDPMPRNALLGSLLGLLLIVALMGLRAVPARLARLRRTDLLAGAGLALGLRATVTALDGSFFVEILRLRLLLLRGTVPRRPLRGRGVLAVVSADARRVLRHRRAVVMVLGASPLVWAGGELYGRVGAAAAGVGLVWAGAGAAAQGLRTISRSRALARAFPMRDEVLRIAHLVLPAAVSTLAALVGVILAGRPLWWIPVLVLVSLSGVLRTAAGRPPARFDLLVAIPMGALPIDAIGALATGPDVVLLGCAPLLLGAGPLLCLLLPTTITVALVLWRRTLH